MAATASSLTAPVAVFLALVLLMFSGTEAKFLSNNITVVGSVYCDACSNNTFSKHSFFLKGARVLIQCNFKVNSTSSEELSLEAERTTDQNGVYKLDVPPVDGFACREGHELRSACRATLVRSSSAACNVPGLRGSTQHIALRSRATNACFLNLNALNFRPAKRDGALCHGGGGGGSGAGPAFGSSLLFWPFLPLFWPPFRLPFPAPGGVGGTVSFPWPFPVPNWLVPFLRPPFLPFPLYVPAPESSVPPPSYRFLPSQEATSRP
ncbi:uncharacterized protein LOC133902053 [Phragmites australis]|uniref:uncharacterized protein LOC133902053 n=1 Tax=Phragmites australis TaxID=29695 RepID=UPI002D7856C7|nr:uncharacterized protein LOC133902053 [Phragmites australis]